MTFALLSAGVVLWAASVFGYSYDEDFAFHSLYYAYGAYCNTTTLSAWDCEWCKYISDFTFVDVVTTDELQAYYGYDAEYGYIVLSYRGTIMTLVDWMDDLDFALSEYPSVSDGYVHTGFYGSYKDLNTSVFSGITSLIHRYHNRGTLNGILITGHSLGGALAQMAALDYYNYLESKGISTDVIVYTFGSPRWGNEVMAKYYDSLIGDNNNRLVNQEDIVPGVPEEVLGYYHTAPEVHYTSVDPLQYQVCDSGESLDCFTLEISIDDHVNYLNLQEGCDGFRRRSRR